MLKIVISNCKKSLDFGETFNNSSKYRNAEGNIYLKFLLPYLGNIYLIKIYIVLFANFIIDDRNDQWN